MQTTQTVQQRSEAQTHGPHQEVEKSKEGSTTTGEARMREDTFAQHDHCTRDGRQRCGCIQRQSV